MRGHQQQVSLHESESLPALFAVLDALWHGYIVWIVEDLGCSPEADTVLSFIGLALSFIPFEPDAVHIHIIMPKM